MFRPNIKTWKLGTKNEIFTKIMFRIAYWGTSNVINRIRIRCNIYEVEGIEKR